jgi:hypothetical protein
MPAYGPTGWVNSPDDVIATKLTMPFANFGEDHWPKVYGDGAGKLSTPYTALKLVRGGTLPRHVQAIGDCVSFGTAMAGMITYANQILAERGKWTWQGDFATEPIYGGSRVEIGGGRVRGDGSIGAWAARWVNEYGVLLRKQYEAIDLATYSGSRAREWGRKGVPNQLEPIAKLNPFERTAQISTTAQARDVIANGGAVILCSSIGFSKRRDRQGFCEPDDRWDHCMCLCGWNDVPGTRKGGLIFNSWEELYDYLVGSPKGDIFPDMPDQCFGADESVIARMLREGDSWAISAMKGYKAPRPIDWSPLWN